MCSVLLVIFGELLHLIGAGDDTRELAFLLVLTFDHSLYNAGVVGAQVHEAMSDAGLTFPILSKSNVPWEPVQKINFCTE